MKSRCGKLTKNNSPGILWVTSVIPDIHGWPADQVQILQQGTAKALGRPVVFRDPEVRVRGIEKVEIGKRRINNGWFGRKDYELIFEEREITVSLTPPEMIIIPAGTFVMGSPEGEEGRREWAGSQHQVTIPRPFAIGRTSLVSLVETIRLSMWLSMCLCQYSCEMSLISCLRRRLWRDA